MVSKVVCAVIVMGVAQIVARPLDSDNIGNGVENVDDEVFGKIYKKFKIPQVITPDSFTITINGTLNDAINEGNADFTVLLADDKNTDVCRIELRKNQLKVSQPVFPEYDSLEIGEELLTSNAFSLRVFARENSKGDKFFDVTFNGMNEAISCVINDLANISFIVIKNGVKNVSNMLFDFEKS